MENLDDVIKFGKSTAPEYDIDAAIASLSSRFDLDIQYRKAGTNWPFHWRVRLIVHDNQNRFYRLTVRSPTVDCAVQTIKHLVAILDEELNETWKNA